MVHVNRVKQRAVSWLSLSNNIALSKSHKPVDELINQVEKNRGRQHRKRDLKKSLDSIGPIHSGRLIKADWYLL